jgi:hypothetical protein
VTGSHLLIAVGRRPNTDDLGLDAAGVALDKRGLSRSMTSFARTYRASGRSGTAMAAGPSHTRPTTTSRSLSPTSSTAIRVVLAIVLWPTISTPTRRLPAWASRRRRYASPAGRA